MLTSRFTNAEQQMLTMAANNGAVSQLQNRLTDAINVFYDAMVAAEVLVGTPPDVPARFKNHVCAYACGEWLRDFPLNNAIAKTFWTDARKTAYTEAQREIEKISNKDAGAISSPTGASTVSMWDSSPRVYGRMWPVTQPLEQFTSVGLWQPPTANQNATSIVPESIAPEPPKNLLALAAASGNSITLTWIQPESANYYILYRGVATGTATSNAPFFQTTANSFTDNQTTNGTAYYYVLVAVNEIGKSVASNEAFAIAGQPISNLNSN